MEREAQKLRTIVEGIKDPIERQGFLSALMFENKQIQSSAEALQTAYMMLNMLPRSKPIKQWPPPETLPLNWRGQRVRIPPNHKLSPVDPPVSAPPKFYPGPFTSQQRDGFLRGNHGGTRLAPHHRHQLPVRDGGVIDEIPGPGHPAGNQHTTGPRHPNRSSLFEGPQGANRAQEIREHFKEKGAV